MKNLLVIRFSSIGDIVLTSPIVRCLSQQKDVKIFYLTKKAFAPLLESNPYIEKIIAFDGNLDNTLAELKSLSIDHIIDLHKNLRSKRVIAALGKPSNSYDKQSLKRWMYVNFRFSNLDGSHVVDRYFRAIKSFEVVPDDKGLELFLPDNFRMNVELTEIYHVYIFGTAHFTKNIPNNYYIALALSHQKPVIFIGGKEHRKEADFCAKAIEHSINLVGETSLLEASYLIKHAAFVFGPDTGMSHIAAAYHKKQAMVFGSTHSNLGFTPYKNKNALIAENKELSCRPCTKQGESKCPKGHFKCMLDLNTQSLIDEVTQLIEN